jgi:hypothetical protein
MACFEELKTGERRTVGVGELMDVWVVMGNDYPDAVFSTEKAAEDYCAERARSAMWRRAKNKAGIEYAGHVVHWRSYKFTMDAK